MYTPYTSDNFSWVKRKGCVVALLCSKWLSSCLSNRGTLYSKLPKLGLAIHSKGLGLLSDHQMQSIIFSLQTDLGKPPVVLLPLAITTSYLC